MITDDQRKRWQEATDARTQGGEWVSIAGCVAVPDYDSEQCDQDVNYVPPGAVLSMGELGCQCDLDFAQVADEAMPLLLGENAELRAANAKLVEENAELRAEVAKLRRGLDRARARVPDEDL